MREGKEEKVASKGLLKDVQAMEMCEDEEEKTLRKKLPKYAIHGDLYISIYTIIISIIWMIYVNKVDDIEVSGNESIFLIFGCLILGSGIYKLTKAIKQKRLKERLFQEGNRLVATVTNIERDGIMFKLGEIEMMGRGSGFKIHAKYEDKNFISPKIGIDVPKYVKVGDKIPVFIDMYNPEEYYMDLDNINSI